MFDKIAPVYDLLNTLLSLGADKSWRKTAIKLIPQSDSKLNILDVATGTADMAIMACKRFPNYHFTGLDLSEGMLKIAQKRLKKMDLVSRIELIQGDSEHLPFAENTFDVVMVAFGVRNFENLDLGIDQIYKVIKPGGQIIVLEFSKPRFFPVKQIFNIYFKYVLPLIGKFGSKDPKAYKYLYESVQQFPDYERFVEKLNKAGFTQSNYRPLTFGICCVYNSIK
ncbi:MAG: bifunctional demethylmenaquinone methyltransferase/2-methoxy-6-polyprenyl-1,4-benzoquinol methylase UbiE [Saprospiraceae bacterium]